MDGQEVHNINNFRQLPSLGLWLFMKYEWTLIASYALSCAICTMSTMDSLTSILPLVLIREHLPNPVLTPLMRTDK